jgi:large subunit ribosomal protein L9
MEIILLKDLDNVGDKHDVVTVKDGYGRNFLIPQKLAVIANPTNMAKLDALRAEEEAKEAARVDEYKQMAEKLDGQTLKIGVKAGTSGKIFGSVTNIQLSQAINDQFGLDIPRKKINMPEEVKEVGTYTAELVLHKEVTTNLDFELVAE